MRKARSPGRFSRAAPPAPGARRLPSPVSAGTPDPPRAAARPDRAAARPRRTPPRCPWSNPSTSSDARTSGAGRYRPAALRSLRRSRAVRRDAALVGERTDLLAHLLRAVVERDVGAELFSSGQLGVV